MRHDRYRKVRIRFRPRGTMFVGDIGVPAAGATINVEAVGEDRAEALQRAALLAERIAKDPIINAMVGPQVLTAVQTAKTLATAARRGGGLLKSAWRKLRGKKKRKLARALALEPRRSPRQPFPEPADDDAIEPESEPASPADEELTDE